MKDWSEAILAAVSRRNYHPLKPKALARKLGVGPHEYSEFRRTLRGLLQEGRLELARNHAIRSTPPHGTIVGTYRRANTAVGFVRPREPGQGVTEILIRAADAMDAATGDEVLVRLQRKPHRHDRLPTGAIVQIRQRGAGQFVGTYFERDDQGFVRVDGTAFGHSIPVGDAGGRNARPDDKVVVELIRYPSAGDRGQGVVTEVLGPRGEPGVDTLSVIRSYELPDRFPEEVLEEARMAVRDFRDDPGHDREDFTKTLVITIDPVDAKDFDDAVCVTRDPESGHWQLAVHVADVSHFAPLGSALDREAKRRATSVYLPQRVLPMFPELISNGIASLQEGERRFVKSVLLDLTPDAKIAHARFANGVIQVGRRFHYDEVTALLDDAHAVEKIGRDLADMLQRMRELALLLKRRRRKRGALELSLPETELEYDEQGRVSGGHWRRHDISHQIIEEFMLAANEAVAQHLERLGVAFLRRIHPAPDPNRLKAYGDFVRGLGYKLTSDTDRFSLQRILDESSQRPDSYAVSYGLLRALKQAVYSPEDEEHYALAAQHYCHFTSPIRRYPDLTIHRMLAQWLRNGKVGSDVEELEALGRHCSRMERRADEAESELVKMKLLAYLSSRIGMELDVIITSVTEYGFFAQSERLPVEGLVHVSTLTDDDYLYDEADHLLEGRRTRRRYRLGDRVHVEVARVDEHRRHLDFHVLKRRR